MVCLDDAVLMGPKLFKLGLKKLAFLAPEGFFI
jgi:hypothetical protein